MARRVEVREMRDAETMLAIIRERGKKGLHLEDVYRQLFNPDLYLRAYGRIYRERRGDDQGVRPRRPWTGCPWRRSRSIIELTPTVSDTDGPPCGARTSRRGTARCVRSASRRGPTSCCKKSCARILEAYYEPQFSDHVPRLPPGRGCHTALRDIYSTWTGTKWFIEGDIKGCFDNIDHTVLLSILREKIHDNRFLILVENLLKAGYLEQWDYRPTLSGTPQGGIVSPLLANIYLDRLDKFVEQTLIPEFTKGERKRTRPEYDRLTSTNPEAQAKGASEEDLKPLREELRIARRARPVRPGLPTAAIHPVRRRLPAGLRRAEGGSRGDQGPAGDVPARSPQAGTLAREDLDHACPHREGPVPRL